MKKAIYALRGRLYRLRRWNDKPDTYPLRWVLFWASMSLVWAIATYIWMWGVPWDWSVWAIPVSAITITFGWFVVLGGGLVTGSFMEANKFIYSDDLLLPPKERRAGRKALVRASTRLEPVVTGLIERFLLATLGMLILLAGTTKADDPPVGALGALGAIGGGYVVLKSIKRFTASDQLVNVSIHSIWGSLLSVAFAFLGAWWFSEEALNL